MSPRERTTLAAVVILGITIIEVSAGIIYLSAMGRDTPQVLVAIVSAAVGALAALITVPPITHRGNNGAYTHAPTNPDARVPAGR